MKNTNGTLTLTLAELHEITATLYHLGDEAPVERVEIEAEDATKSDLRTMEVAMEELLEQMREVDRLFHNMFDCR